MSSKRDIIATANRSPSLDPPADDASPSGAHSASRTLARVADSEAAALAEKGLSVAPEDLGTHYLRDAAAQDNLESSLEVEADDWGEASSLDGVAPGVGELQRATPEDVGDDFAALRREMVEQLRGKIGDARVLQAMGRVPRHLFVPHGVRQSAYVNSPLPIGHGQTISQPLMVALTLEAAQLEGDERVLEVGAGSGYQAALLAQLAREVYGIELIPTLAERARHTLSRLEVANVAVLQGDGTQGHDEGAPYEVIIVAAATDHTPDALIRQLTPEGRLLIPLADGKDQILTRVRKRDDKIQQEPLYRCAFVPLITPEPPQR